MFNYFLYKHSRLKSIPIITGDPKQDYLLTIYNSYFGYKHMNDRDINTKILNNVDFSVHLVKDKYIYFRYKGVKFGLDGDDKFPNEEEKIKWVNSLFNDTPKIIKELDGTVCYKGAYNDFMTFHRQFKWRIKNFNYGKWNTPLHEYQKLRWKYEKELN